MLWTTCVNSLLLPQDCVLVWCSQVFPINYLDPLKFHDEPEIFLHFSMGGSAQSAQGIQLGRSGMMLTGPRWEHFLRRGVPTIVRLGKVWSEGGSWLQPWALQHRRIIVLLLPLWLMTLTVMSPTHLTRHVLHGSSLLSLLTKCSILMCLTLNSTRFCPRTPEVPPPRTHKILWEILV